MLGVNVLMATYTIVIAGLLISLLMLLYFFCNGYSDKFRHCFLSIVTYTSLGICIIGSIISVVLVCT